MKPTISHELWRKVCSSSDKSWNARSTYLLICHVVWQPIDFLVFGELSYYRWTYLKNVCKYSSVINGGRRGMYFLSCAPGTTTSLAVSSCFCSTAVRFSILAFSNMLCNSACFCCVSYLSLWSLKQSHFRLHAYLMYTLWISLLLSPQLLFLTQLTLFLQPGVS